MSRTVILASTSPRRRTLLQKVVPHFMVCAPSLAREVLDPTLALPEALEKLALEKAESVATTYPEAIIIGADTIVCKDGQLLGKPANAEEASRMLEALSGRAHEVITAVAVLCKETGRVQTVHGTSRVTFRTLTAEDISGYIATGEPLDKAGAYGIQGEGGKFVTNLEGDFDNVVGLPTALVAQLLEGVI